MSGQKKKGFTLVELVVVLVIMTVILGIAIPSVLHYMKMAEFRKNEENAKTVYLAAESKLTYYRSSGQWEEFKKEVMSQGKEAPFTDSKRKGKIYGITLDKEHDGASASNNAVLGLLDGYTYDKSMLDATTSTSILRLAKVAESLKEQQTIYASIQALSYYQRGSQSTNEYRSSEKVTSNSSNTLYGDDSTENKIKVAYFRHLSNIRYEEEDMLANEIAQLEALCVADTPTLQDVQQFPVLTDAEWDMIENKGNPEFCNYTLDEVMSEPVVDSIAPAVVKEEEVECPTINLVPANPVDTPVKVKAPLVSHINHAAMPRALEIIAEVQAKLAAQSK